MQSKGSNAWVVHKFGGSSVADAACFRKVADILESQPSPRLAVVLSAWGVALWWLGRMGDYVAPERFLASDGREDL